MEIGDPSFTLSGSREIENGDDSCSSLSLIKPSIELERRIINATKKNSTKEVFKLYKGAIHPRLREARLSAPLTPIFCKAYAFPLFCISKVSEMIFKTCFYV
ncbi:hypothetical protein [Sulfolobus tengchongensis spindle-shaped virus 4]|nr:hypothetical protein [Sulfolobus tengchongensis spindle-shaped virus 4]